MTSWNSNVLLPTSVVVRFLSMHSGAVSEVLVTLLWTWLCRHKKRLCSVYQLLSPFAYFVKSYLNPIRKDLRPIFVSLVPPIAKCGEGYTSSLPGYTLHTLPAFFQSVTLRIPFRVPTVWHPFLWTCVCGPRSGSNSQIYAVK